ncbi:hypothetical protein DXG01_015638 [Tephrocybe rancida]|nr:hypothetical protein DXG01_015638 [Tephrocybe rancida]
MEPLRAYTGTKRKLLIALDIGTTCSGASYSVLESGRIPEIKAVTRFGDQEHVGGDSKVPSILLYNRNDGRFLAAGSKAIKMEENFSGGVPPWYKVEWFKLHMRPNPRLTNHITKAIPALPPKLGIVDIFADYLRYLYTSVLDFIQETLPMSAVSCEREFVITHPNGWEGVQQFQLRRAAITGGLIPDTDDARARIHFVTEGEAGLHFCIRQGLVANGLKNGEGVLVIDAGGGTIDMSAYGRKSSSGEDHYYETCAPQYRLRDSSFSEDVQHIASCFDKTTKLRFSNIDEPQYVKFGRPSDRCEALGISCGQIRINGLSVFLIGGFSASNWLYQTLKASLHASGLELLRPDSHLNKAVADGAVSYYIDHLVKARVSKYTYGIASYTPYNIANVEHRRRLASVFTDSDGVDNVQHIFSPILPKV